MTQVASSIGEFLNYFERKDEAGDKARTRQVFGGLNHELKRLNETEIRRVDTDQ